MAALDGEHPRFPSLLGRKDAMSQLSEGDLDTPLLDRHRLAGAQFTEFGGWRMPLRYSSELAEHRAVRSSAGLFDLSHMGEVLVTGPDAASWLDYALIGKSRKMMVGRARYNLLVDERGGILDDLIVYRLAEQVFLLVVNAANRLADVAVFMRRQGGFEVEIEDVTSSSCLLAIQGPRALSILDPLVHWRGLAGFGVLFPAAAAVLSEGHDTEEEPTLAETGYYRIGSGEISTAEGLVTVLLARTGYTGEDGFEILVPVQDTHAVWDALISAGGRDLTLCGLASRDTLRLEAGMPLYGHELTTEITPFAAGLGRVVGFDKPDGAVGLEALAARRDETPERTLDGIALEGRRAAREGNAVLSEAGEPLGTVTSGALSPTLGHPVAMAYLPAEVEPGAAVLVDVRGKRLPATVVALPFYRRN
jgi:aminomethyltransferase